MVFRNEIIHAEHLDLFSFLVGILCHHNPKPLIEMIQKLYHKIAEKSSVYAGLSSFDKEKTRGSAPDFVYSLYSLF